MRNKTQNSNDEICKAIQYMEDICYNIEITLLTTLSLYVIYFSGVFGEKQKKFYVSLKLYHIKSQACKTRLKKQGIKNIALSKYCSSVKNHINICLEFVRWWTMWCDSWNMY